MAVIIGVDPHKASHTAAAIDDNEKVLGELRVRSAAGQVERLVTWAEAFGERIWAIEGAAGLGYLVAQQLVAAGESVVDVQPKLAARVRLLATGNTNKNDPNDARCVAIAALRSATPKVVVAEDHAAVMKVWAKRHRDLGRHRTRMACRLHAVLCELVPGGVAGEITAGHANKLLDSIDPQGAIETARHELAVELVDDLAGIDTQMRATKKRITAAVTASETTTTGIFGVGPIVAGHRRRRCRRRDPLRHPGQLRRLQRDRTHRGVVGAPQDLPAVPAREPPHQPSKTSATGSHPESRLFGEATPGPAPTLRRTAADHRPQKTPSPGRTHQKGPLDTKRTRSERRVAWADRVLGQADGEFGA